MMKKVILDACCGSRMFWFDKTNPAVLFMDKRKLKTKLCDGRTLEISPDLQADFMNMPFKDNTFHLVVFDPPHLLRAGKNSWLAKKYGKLDKNWMWQLQKGFDECMRVLKKNGVLVFKWNEQQITVQQALMPIGRMPLFGHRRGKTIFLVFMKLEDTNGSNTSRV